LRVVYNVTTCLALESGLSCVDDVHRCRVCDHPSGVLLSGADLVWISTTSGQRRTDNMPRTSTSLWNSGRSIWTQSTLIRHRSLWRTLLILRDHHRWSICLFVDLDLWDHYRWSVCLSVDLEGPPQVKYLSVCRPWGTGPLQVKCLPVCRPWGTTTGEVFACLLTLRDRTTTSEVFACLSTLRDHHRWSVCLFVDLEGPDHHKWSICLFVDLEGPPQVKCLPVRRPWGTTTGEVLILAVDLWPLNSYFALYFSCFVFVFSSFAACLNLGWKVRTGTELQYCVWCKSQ